MKTQIEQVKDFRTAFKLPINTALSALSTNDKGLHLNLLQEELDELTGALYIDDKIETLDAIVDILYVLLGLVNHLGFNELVEPVFNEIHASNMSKLDAAGNPIYREDGKVLKGPNYFKPNLNKLFDDNIR